MGLPHVVFGMLAACGAIERARHPGQRVSLRDLRMAAAQMLAVDVGTLRPRQGGNGQRKQTTQNHEGDATHEYATRQIPDLDKRRSRREESLHRRRLLFGLLDF